MTSKVDNIIKAYANDLDGLTREECLGEDFSEKQCEVLVDALASGTGADGIITPEEKTALEQAGFAKDFIQDLAGTDGKKALQTRVRWLGDHIHTKWFRLDYDFSQRSAMIKELGTIGPDAKEAIPSLINAFNREYWLVANVGDALGKIGKDAVPALTLALKDEDRFVRFYAAMALNKIGPDAKAAVPELINALKDQDKDVRFQAARALANIGLDIKKSLPALLTTLEEIKNREEALGHVSPNLADTVPSLINELKDKKRSVRLKAVVLLGDIADYAPHKFINALRFFNSDWVEVYNAALDVDRIGKEIIPALIEALKDQEEDVRYDAINALGQIGKPAFFSIPVLQEMAMNDPSPTCRRRAQWALDTMMEEIR